MWLVSRLLGMFGVSRWWEFFKTLCLYVAFLVKLKFGLE
jgi:hypothetical protein